MIELMKTKKHYIMVLAIMFVVVSLSGTTYSLFINVDVTNELTYSTGILDLQVIEGEQIRMVSAFPMIDSEGMKGDDYALTIKNTGNLPYLFDLKMLSSTDEDVISTKYIKFQVNDGKASTLYNVSNVIASNILLYPNEEITFNVRVWLDISTPNSELGNTFIAKIVTTGASIYRTLDTSGANHPKLYDGMIPVYYDDSTDSFRKADKSNMVNAYEWYNYDKQRWANVVKISDSDKKIYDVTGKRDIKIDSVRTNNSNFVSDVTFLDIGLNNYSYNNISNILRVKFNNLDENIINIISNGVMSYYYDNVNSKFVFKINDKLVNSSEYKLDEKKWYILGYTYDKNTVRFYIDGIEIASANIDLSISSKNGFRLGVDSSFNNVSNIEFGDVYIYNDILTNNEISKHYNKEINILYDNLMVGYNDFEPKTLYQYYMSSDMGTVISNNDVNSYYVWIPRFKYKLWNVTGEPSVSGYDAYNKGIDIVFEKDNETTGTINCQNNICYSDNLYLNRVTKKDNLKYYTHPAFSYNGEELTGIWVSKYEISTNSNNCNATNIDGCISDNLKIESKLNNNVWRNNTLSNYYKNVKKLGDNYSIIKNSEWGAISYFTHSKYGLCIDSKCNKMGVNNTYISGNNINDSTTNNMYGIFDLSGSASEFVMSGYDFLSTDEFGTSLGLTDDYEIYKDNKFILGDSIGEITINDGIWDNNYHNLIDSVNNIFIRGGIGTTLDNGIFYYNSTSNMNSEFITTRIVIR